jgi:AmmeMemoRadiSam system protein B
MDLLARADRARRPDEIQGRIYGLMVPHAGYIYSGAVAASGYQLLAGSDIRSAVLISPSHQEFFPFASIFSGDAYETPLGQVQVDRELADSIGPDLELVRKSGRGHAQDHLMQGEHALEVQLPFLQCVFPEVKIVPIVLGDQSWETCNALGLALGPVLKRPDVVIIASSDLSHFHNSDEATRLDGNFLEVLERMDPKALFEAVRKGDCEACGMGPVVSAMTAGREAGASQCRVIDSCNSGDISGDRSRVVGYAAAAIF